MAGASEAPAGIDPPGLPGLIHPAGSQEWRLGKAPAAAFSLTPGGTSTAFGRLMPALKGGRVLVPDGPFRGVPGDGVQARPRSPLPAPPMDCLRTAPLASGNDCEYNPRAANVNSQEFRDFGPESCRAEWMAEGILRRRVPEVEDGGLRFANPPHLLCQNSV